MTSGFSVQDRIITFGATCTRGDLLRGTYHQTRVSYRTLPLCPYTAGWLSNRLLTPWAPPGLSLTAKLQDPAVLGIRIPRVLLSRFQCISFVEQNKFRNKLDLIWTQVIINLFCSRKN